MSEETIRARGHEHVRAEHTSTLEVTTEDYLTPAGDCILGIGADRAPADFDPAFVAACQTTDAELTVTLVVDGVGRWHATGRGDPRLTFASDRSMVCRTSEYVDDRTVMLGADGAAVDVDRDLVEALASGADLTCTLRVEGAD